MKKLKGKFLLEDSQWKVVEIDPKRGALTYYKGLKNYDLMNIEEDCEFIRRIMRSRHNDAEAMSKKYLPNDLEEALLDDCLVICRTKSDDLYNQLEHHYFIMGFTSDLLKSSACFTHKFVTSSVIVMKLGDLERIMKKFFEDYEVRENIAFVPAEDVFYELVDDTNYLNVYNPYDFPKYYGTLDRVTKFAQTWYNYNYLSKQVYDHYYNTLIKDRTDPIEEYKEFTKKMDSVLFYFKNCVVFEGFTTEELSTFPKHPDIFRGIVLILSLFKRVEASAVPVRRTDVPAQAVCETLWKEDEANE